MARHGSSVDEGVAIVAIERSDAGVPSLGPSDRDTARPPAALTGPSALARSLDALTGLRVEWDDGVVGRVEGVALFVRTGGFGTTRRKLELLPLDDVAALLPEEGRIIARTRVAPARTAGDVVARVVMPALSRLVRRRR